MATTTPRATSPTEPFPPLDTGLRTPSTLPPAITLTNQSALTATSDPKSLFAPRNTTSSETVSRLGLSPKLGGLPRSPRISPVQLTGAGAMADLKRHKQQQSERAANETFRQTSPNPALAAMQTLMGGQGVSRPSDAPAPGKLSEPLQKVAEKINMSQIPAHSDTSLQVSPTSMTSFGSMETAGTSTALTSTAASSNAGARQYVAEPTSMADEPAPMRINGAARTATDDGNKAFSYPGPTVQTPEEITGRGMSYPGFGQDSPKSPPASSSKRHKCPYCSTDFTRHHNLKSHLLTHSQEKPYECNSCHARFRRLHDLKRHSKLHTGERPHTCDKCGRRFARGDALARHNKGPGGCAGRRGSFNGDDDYDGTGGEGMDGVEYTGGNDDDESADHPRRVSEPSRKRAHHDSGDESSHSIYRQHSSTYPPAPTQRHSASVSSNMGPPQVVHPGNNTSGPPRELLPSAAASTQYFGNNGQVLGQNSMIESPKPLSPGQPHEAHRLSVGGDLSMSSNRGRSPSLTTQFQQQHFGRGTGGRTPPQPTMHYPPANNVLPPLQPTSNRQTRTSLSSAHLPANSGPGVSALSAHGRGMSTTLGLSEQTPSADLWNAMRHLEQRFDRLQHEYELRMSRMQDEHEIRISRLQDEVMSLKQQLSASSSYSSNNQPGETMSGVARFQ